MNRCGRSMDRFAGKCYKNVKVGKWRLAARNLLPVLPSHQKTMYTTSDSDYEKEYKTEEIYNVK